MKKTDVTSWEQLPLVMNVHEVAGLIGCGEQTIRMLCHAKEIPHFKHGRAFCFLREKIRQWIEQISEVDERRQF